MLALSSMSRRVIWVAPPREEAVVWRSCEMLTPRLNSSSKTPSEFASHALIIAPKPKRFLSFLGSQPESKRRRIPSTLLLKAAKCEAGISMPSSWTFALPSINSRAASWCRHSSASPSADTHAGISNKGCVLRVVRVGSARCCSKALISCGSPSKAA